VSEFCSDCGAGIVNKCSKCCACEKFSSKNNVEKDALMKALSFYGDEWRWHKTSSCDSKYSFKMVNDGGRVARDAIASVEV